MQFITVTGRRVEISPMTGEEEKLLLRAAKNPKQKTNVNKQLISKLVEPTPIWEKLTVGEETDLLYLIRLYSVGKSMPLRLSRSGRVQDFEVDIREFTRFALECGDPKCPCHNYVPVKTTEEFLASDQLAVDLSEIPEGHYEANPPDMSLVLPRSGDKVTHRISLCEDKAVLGAWMEDMDPAVISKALAHLTVRIECKDGTVLTSDTPQDARAQYKYYMKAIQQDRLAVRDSINSFDCGLDTEVELFDPYSMNVFETRVDMDVPFWMPRAKRKSASRLKTS